MKWADLLLLYFAGLMGRISLAPVEIPILLIAICSARLLVVALGRDIPILEVTAVVYCLQLLIGPQCSYYSPPEFYRYKMVVSSEDYFRFAIPAVAAYLLPIVWVRHQLPMLAEVMSFSAGRKVFQAGIMIMLAGVVFTILGRYAPPSLAFDFFLRGELKFVVALYC